MRDPIHYTYRTFADGSRPKHLYETKVKNFWEPRCPRRPDTIETVIKEQLESSFNDAHHISPTNHNPVKNVRLREFL